MTYSATIAVSGSSVLERPSSLRTRSYATVMALTVSGSNTASALRSSPINKVASPGFRPSVARPPPLRVHGLVQSELELRKIAFIPPRHSQSPQMTARPSCPAETFRRSEKSATVTSTVAPRLDHHDCRSRRRNLKYPLSVH